jgi:pyruvate dehydrogenase E2 component (dihydrolipoamide acetyltransferase)
MAETISMPKLGFDMAEGTLVRWLKKEGEPVNKGEVLAEIETDKATVEVESTAGGVVRRLLVDEGAVVPVNTPIAIIGAVDEKIEAVAPQAGQTSKVEGRAAAAPDKTAVPVESAPIQDPSSAVRASPLAKKIAREQKVDLANIKGTGPGGRIVRQDIEAALAGGTNLQSPILNPQSSAADETISMSKLRQAIARRMAEAKTTIPHFYVTHEYKVDSLLDLRRQLNKLQAENEQISVNDFTVKATALALRQFPNLNASLVGASVIRHGAVNIGIAVSVEGGLLTIVCKNADRKPLRQIAAEVKAMAGRARQGKVRPEDIEGSTFSISNLGMFDVENFAAIINPPEAAVLAVGTARLVPVVVGADGIRLDSEALPRELGAGWQMKATLSVDHRVSDGVEAARFLQALAVFLEEPLRLVL